MSSVRLLRPRPLLIRVLVSDNLTRATASDVRSGVRRAEGELRRSQGAPHTGEIIVDLRWLRSADDMGARALAEAVASARGRGIDVDVAEGPDAVRRIIHRVTPLEPRPPPPPEQHGTVSSEGAVPAGAVHSIATLALGGLDWVLSQLVEAVSREDDHESRVAT